MLGAFPDASRVASVLLLACCGLALSGIGTTYDDIDHFLLRTGTRETADIPLDDLIRWTRTR